MAEDTSYQETIKSYSLEQLKGILQNLNRDAYPQRYQVVLDQILKKEPDYLSQFSTEQITLPISLKVIIGLFLIQGGLAIIDIIQALLKGSVGINITIICLGIAWGLYNLIPGWRIAALVWTWIMAAGVSLSGIVALFIPSSRWKIRISGQMIDANSVLLLKLGILVFVTAVAVLCVWQYRVLNRSDIRKLFGAEPPNKSLNRTA